jgi:hypothetical protein
MLKIHETLGENGQRQSIYLKVSDGELVLIEDERHVAISSVILFTVFERYGKPLDATTRLDGAKIELGNGVFVHHLRHLAKFDVIGRDYLVLVRPGKEPLAELAISISGALLHLTRNAS